MQDGIFQFTEYDSIENDSTENDSTKPDRFEPDPVAERLFSALQQILLAKKIIHIISALPSTVQTEERNDLWA
jgi:hypothetical protein